MTYTLAITDRAYSSWSLRGWLLFAKLDIPVGLAFARSYDPGFLGSLAEFAPARTVPALRIEGGRAPIVVWDSLAIAETLAERFPDRAFWPGDLPARGLARSLAAEMHAGFRALREECPMNLRRAYVGFTPSEGVRADIARIEELWSLARTQADEGPWLFGRWTAADAFFAPVAARIATYDLAVGDGAAAYVATQLADPAFVAWRAEGLADDVVQTVYDKDLPERPWPGPA
jgi:glutathione S-transferase